jgi:hypothetical protein
MMRCRSQIPPGKHHRDEATKRDRHCQEAVGEQSLAGLFGLVAVSHSGFLSFTPGSLPFVNSTPAASRVRLITMTISADG